MESLMSRIFSWTLNLGYLTVILLAGPWILWVAWRHGTYRHGAAAKLLGRVPIRRGKNPCVWFHAVSVGEVNLLASTISEMQQAAGDVEIVVSTTTRTGYELACRKYQSLNVFYCPLDFSWAVQEAMRRIRPCLLVLAELELWPNLISAANTSGARVAIVNGRVSDRSFRGYQRIRSLTARVLRNVDLITAQSGESAARFCALGAPVDSVHDTGSLKFDGVEVDRDNRRTKDLAQLAQIGAEDLVWLAGSTQAPEEQLVLKVYKKLRREYPKLRLILVPRHQERFEEVAALLAASGMEWQRRTELDGPSMQERSAPRQDPNRSSSSRRETAASVLLVNTIGELRHWWGVAHIAVVGGSFGNRGGQNMLEPAAYGAAVCFGPNTRNFRDIVARLLDVDGARSLADAQELESFLREVLGDPQQGVAMGNRARELVISQQGATARTVELLLSAVNLQNHAAPQSRVA